MPSEGTVRTEIVYALPNTARAVNVFHFRTFDDSEPGASDITNLHNKIRNLFEFDYSGGGTPLLSFLSPNATLVEFRTITIGPSTPLDITLTVNEPGGNLGPSLPNEAATVIRFYTSSAGRSKQGRCYMPIPTTHQMSVLGVLDPTTVGEITQQFRDWNNDIFNNTDFFHGIFSRKLDSIDIIADYQCQQILHHIAHRNKV